MAGGGEAALPHLQRLVHGPAVTADIVYLKAPKLKTAICKPSVPQSPCPPAGLQPLCNHTLPQTL